MEPDEPALWRVFLPIVLPIFLSVVDGTIVAAALPAMAGAFGTVERVSWVVASYLVASSVAAPVYGRLGDAFGRRRLLLIALGVFVTASTVCAAAQGVVSLTIARVLQGFGGGGLMVLSQALLGATVPRRQLGRAQGISAAVIVASSTFGPVAGGVLTQAFGWRSIFLVNLPLGALAVLLARRLPATGGGERNRFDWLGLSLFGGWAVPLLMTLEHLQHVDSNSLPFIAGGLGTSFACFFGLWCWERRTSHPLFPLAVLSHPAIWRANAMAACSGALLVSEATLLPIHLRAIDGASAGQIGWMMLPLTATIGVGSLVTGRLVSRTGLVAVFPSVGQTVAASALLFTALYAAPAGGALGPWCLPLMLATVALFQGSAMPVAQITAQSLAPSAMLGSVTAAVQLSRSIGSAVGVTITLGVLFAVLGQHHEAAAVFAEAIRQGPDSGSALPSPARMLIQAHITSGFTAAFLAIATFAAINAVLACTLPFRRL